MANPVQLPKVVPIRSMGGDKGKSVAVDIPVKIAAEKCKGVQSSNFEFQSQESQMGDIHGISKGVVAVKSSSGGRDFVNINFPNNQEACVGKGVDRENGLQQPQYDNVKNGMGSKIGPDGGLNGMDMDVGSSVGPKTRKWKRWARDGSRLNTELGLEAQLGKRSLVSNTSDDVK
ncbi:hypothetical protein Q3G72_030535 [Acer saccharum]|nr:hypothetical protein Q3G72_030535 [Acer saccharum]